MTISILIQFCCFSTAVGVLQPYEYLDLLKPFRTQIVAHLSTLTDIPQTMRDEADLRLQEGRRIPKIRRKILRLLADEINNL